MTKSGSFETQHKYQEWGQQRAHHLSRNNPGIEPGVHCYGEELAR